MTPDYSKMTSDELFKDLTQRLGNFNKSELMAIRAIFDAGQVHERMKSIEGKQTAWKAGYDAAKGQAPIGIRIN